MSPSSYTLERDLREAKAMTEALIPYVYEETLYGATRTGMFGGGNMPALTIGALLMRLRRLRALDSHLTPEQKGQLAQLEDQHASVRKEWREHYLTKLHREGESRLKAMNTFFDECDEDPRQCPNVYLPEVLRRTIVQEIARALTEQEGADEKLTREMRRIDGKLRRVTQPAEFVWDKDLKEAYPETEFWWMYAKPPRV